MNRIEEIKKLYCKIWDKCEKNIYTVTKERTPYTPDEVSFAGLAHFVSMKGKKYDKGSERLLVIGRAVNGWNNDVAKSNLEYGDYVEKSLKSEGFNWVIDKNGVLYDERGSYCLSTPFWLTAKSVLDRLSYDERDTKWVEHIAWTNLYKIAPTNMDNPDKKMKAEQQEECIEILKHEIELYNPTHILAITGWDDWFEHFASIFQDVQIYGKNVMCGKNKNDIYVEATAKYNKIPITIVCRPENRNKGDYNNDLFKYIR